MSRKKQTLSAAVIGLLAAGFAIIMAGAAQAATHTAAFLAPVLRPIIRNDAAGLGHYGAPRGARTHQGIDFLVEPGEPIRSPVNGIFTRLAYPYPGTTQWKGLVITSGDLELKMFYVDPLPITPGTQVSQGQIIGFAQDISQRYPGQGMQPHLHLEVRRAGQLIDPATLMPGLPSQPV